MKIISDILNKFNLKNIIYNEKIDYGSSILLYNYNKNKKIRLDKKTVVVFYEPINKEKENNILKNIDNSNMIIKTIKFIIRGTKEDKINIDKL